MIKPWIKAARLPSLLYILLPLLWGYRLSAEGFFSWPIFLWALCFQLYLVFANDLADEVSDRGNDSYRFCSGGSRVLVDGDLTRPQLKRAIVIVLTCYAVLSGVLFYQSPSWILLCILNPLLLWAYSFPPFALSYKGGGEWLQAIGQGVCLPLCGVILGGGNLENIYFHELALFFILHFAMALTTTIPDESSDLRSCKKTYAVRYGGAVTQNLIQWLQVFLLGSFVWLYESSQSFWILGIAALGIVLSRWRFLEFSLMSNACLLGFMLLSPNFHVPSLDFAFLDWLMLLPAVSFWILRKDLRPMFGRMILCSLPFAVTEIIFYPQYWRPKSLFDFLDRFGFCLEDFVFVSTLSIVVSGCYLIWSSCHPERSSRHPERSSRHPERSRGIPLRLLKVLLLTSILLFVSLQLTDPIYATLIAMALVFCVCVWMKPDLIKVGVCSGLITMVLYALILWFLVSMKPQIFQHIWQESANWGVYFKGLLLEEIAYGFLSGALGGVFYPFVTGARVVEVLETSA